MGTVFGAHIKFAQANIRRNDFGYISQEKRYQALTYRYGFKILK